MNAYLLYIKLALVAVLVGAVCFGTYKLTSDHYVKQEDALKLSYQTAYDAAVKAQLDEVTSHQATIIQAENDHAKNQTIIDNLSSQLDSLQHVTNVCSSPAAKADALSAGTNGSSGVFHGRVDAATEHLQAGIELLLKRADQLNIDAIAANASNK